MKGSKQIISQMKSMESTQDPLDFGLSLKHPVPLLRQIKFEPRTLIPNLAKSLLNLAKGDLDDAFESALDALQATSVRRDPEYQAWTLIFAALMRTGLQLVKQAHEENLRKSTIPDDATMESFVETVADVMEHSTAKIYPSFFERPGSYALISEVEYAFQYFLENCGVAGKDAKLLAKRLPMLFELNVHAELRKNPDGFSAMLQAVNSPAHSSAEEKRRWAEYTVVLRKQVSAGMLGQSLTLQQLFIPPRAYRKGDFEYTYDEFNSMGTLVTNIVRVNRQALDLRLHLLEWVREFNPDDCIRVVSGGPGAGKSSLCRMFAAEVYQRTGVPTIYCPLNDINPRRDLIEAVAAFAAQYSSLPANPLHARLGEKRLLIIFDGLDELRAQGPNSSIVAREFVEEVQRKAENFAGQGLERQFLLTGRDIAVQESENVLRKTHQILHLLPYVIPNEDYGKYYDPEKVIAQDHRLWWWRHFLRLIGRGENEIPHDLLSPNAERKGLLEVTRQPLLNFLVALIWSWGRLDLATVDSLNQVYRHLLSAVFERRWEKEKHPGTADLSKQRFERLLEEVALAAWHWAGTAVPASRIVARCDAAGLTTYLKQFDLEKEHGLERLLMAFYVRRGQERDGEKTFEFTHKSFSEYLVSLRLLRMSRRVREELQIREEEPEKGWSITAALLHLVDVCGPTLLDTYIRAFFKGELSGLPLDECRDIQLYFGRLLSYVISDGAPMEDSRVTTYREMLMQSANAEIALLVIHCDCAMISGVRSAIDWRDKYTFASWFKRVQGQREMRGAPSVCNESLAYLDISGCDVAMISFDYANFEGASLAEANARGSSFYRAKLDGADLSVGDFRNCDFSGASLRGCKCNGADFRGARFFRTALISSDLTEVKLHSATFLGADLASANLTGANMNYADFDSSNLSGAKLHGAQVKKALLKNANLTGVVADDKTLEQLRRIKAAEFLPEDS